MDINCIFLFMSLFVNVVQLKPKIIIKKWTSKTCPFCHIFNKLHGITMYNYTFYYNKMLGQKIFKFLH